MPKQIVIAEQHRIAAVFAEDQIQELIVATGTHQVGDIYLGSVENVLPGIDAAFVNLGDSDRNGFMHVTDLGPLRLKRSAGSITELLAPQQKVLVQIMKEPTGNKGPRLTGNVSLPGRYLVLMPYGRGVNLSRRIGSEQERNRLRALAILVKPAGMGLLVRTEAEGMDEEAIIEDLESLQKQWETVQQEAQSTRPPALLNRDDDFIQRVLRDVYSADVNRIATDSSTGLKRVKQHLTTWSGGRMPQGVVVDHHRERVPLLEYFRVHAAIREALKPRVDLPSGGYIIIEPTEALTVIDVNSGSFTRSATARETVLWTNCEAADEIARQLRLRNLAGVIIVDFIDMESRRDQLQVLENFNKALRADKSRPQISQLSELGLVELTRKRQGQNLYELFGRPCPTCGGLGHLVQLPGETASLEPVIPESSGREGGGRPMSSHPSLREGRGEVLEPHADLQDLELINHPSYQEQGGKTSRRRRRRDAPPSSRSNGRRDTTRNTPLPELPARESRESREIREPRDIRETRESREPYEEAEGREARESRESVAEATPALSSRASRGRSSSRDRKPAAASEVVMVEMTPEEQRIYAMMGVSPLMLSTQVVNDPKNAVITVVLPGQAGEDSPALEGAALDADGPAPEEATLDGIDWDTDSEASEARMSATRATPTLVNRASVPATPVVTVESSVDSPVDAATMAPGGGSLTIAVEDGEENGSGRRRRRRRSSASGNEGGED
ncbi:Rne/Rng family ribonuclease [Leptolyngbya sp. PCC 6406]|uniref:Rne/Rng family ribonuclease n=1 Tax=Leptolyngbya sp. PCC 6406 TaxID=1173264 RepID=UPI0002AD0B52|nr:Rne/Rng family ribonuclease [Leptolyngbya sp. PCC 6406]